MRTDATLRRWSVEEVRDEDVVPAVDVEADAFVLLCASMVPVTSIRCPTCFFRSLSEPSRV